MARKRIVEGRARPKAEFDGEDRDEAVAEASDVEIEERPAPEEEEEGVAAASDDDDDEAPSPREQKKKNRYSEMRKAVEEKDRALAEERRRADMAQLEANQHRMYAQGVQALMGRQAQVDPHATELERLGKEQSRLIEAFQGRQAGLKAGESLPVSDVQKFREDHQALQDARYRVIARQNAPEQKPQVTHTDVQVAAADTLLRSKYPDVMSNQQAQQYAGHLYSAKLTAGTAREKALEEAMSETRKQFKMQSPEPTEIERKRFTGHGSAGLAGGNGGGKRQIHMTEDMKKLAIRKYPKLAPNEAIKKWASVVGPGVLEDEATYGR